MTSSKILFFFFFLTSMALSSSQEEPGLLYKYCSTEEQENGNSSTYKQNLKTLFSSISTNPKIDYGFYHSSAGEASVIGLCRPDIPPETCHGCLKNLTESLWTACPSSKQTIGGVDNCMLRYSNHSILGVLETGPYFWVYSLKNVTDVDGFNKSRTTLLRRLADEAAAGSSYYKYAVGKIGAPNSENIYAMVQCTPDLSEMECSSCLNQAIDLVPKCCNNRQGGRVIMPSCNFRYEIDLFYDLAFKIKLPIPPAPAPAPESTVASAPKPDSGAPETGKVSGVAEILIMGSFLLLL